MHAYELEQVNLVKTKTRTTVASGKLGQRGGTRATGRDKRNWGKIAMYLIRACVMQMYPVMKLMETFR